MSFRLCASSHNYVLIQRRSWPIFMSFALSHSECGVANNLKLLKCLTFVKTTSSLHACLESAPDSKILCLHSILQRFIQEISYIAKKKHQCYRRHMRSFQTCMTSIKIERFIFRETGCHFYIVLLLIFKDEKDVYCHENDDIISCWYVHNLT